MKTLIYCKNDVMLDGFKFGCDFRLRYCNYHQGVDERGYWLLIEDDTDGDNQTYELRENGLEHTDTGVII